MSQLYGIYSVLCSVGRLYRADLLVISHWNHTFPPGFPLITKKFDDSSPNTVAIYDS